MLGSVGSQGSRTKGRCQFERHISRPFGGGGKPVIPTNTAMKYFNAVNHQHWDMHLVEIFKVDQ